MVVMLDAFYTIRKLARNQQEKIAHLITGMCEELIGPHEREDLKSLYDYYCGQDYDAAIQEGDGMAMNY